MKLLPELEHLAIGQSNCWYCWQESDNALKITINLNQCVSDTSCCAKHLRKICDLMEKQDRIMNHIPISDDAAMAFGTEDY